MFYGLSYIYFLLLMLSNKCSYVQTKYKHTVNTLQDLDAPLSSSVKKQEKLSNQVETIVNTKTQQKVNDKMIVKEKSVDVILCPDHYENRLGSDECDICDFLTEEMTGAKSTSKVERNDKQYENILAEMLLEIETLGLHDNEHISTKYITIDKNLPNMSNDDRIKCKLHCINPRDITVHEKGMVNTIVDNQNNDLEKEIMRKLSKTLGVIKVNKLIKIIKYNIKSLPKKNEKSNKNSYYSLIKTINVSNHFNPTNSIELNGQYIKFELKKYDMLSNALTISQRKIFSQNRQYKILLYPQYNVITQKFDLSYTKHHVIEYEKIINQLFFVDDPNDNSKSVLNPNMWDLVVFIPEIMFYFKWRSKINKLITIVTIELKKSLEKELFLIYRMLSDYTEKQSTCLLDPRTSLGKSIASFRHHIHNYLFTYHEDSIQYYLFNIAINQEHLRQTNTQFCAILNILAFTIDTDPQSYCTINSIKHYLELHQNDCFSNFKHFMFRCIERNSFVFTALENAVAYLKNIKYKQNMEVFTVTLAHPFYKYFLMMKIDAKTGAFMNIKYAKIADVVSYYYVKIIRTIVDE